MRRRVQRAKVRGADVRAQRLDPLERLLSVTNRGVEIAACPGGECTAAQRLGLLRLETGGVINGQRRRELRVRLPGLAQPEIRVAKLDGDIGARDCRRV